MKFHETVSRSVAKAVSYRFVSILVTMVFIAYAIDDIWKAFWLILAVHMINIALYTAHERFWLRIKWGYSK